MPERNVIGGNSRLKAVEEKVPVPRFIARLRIAALAVLVAALPVFAVGWVSYSAARDSLIEETEQYHLMLIEQIQERSDALMDTVERIVLQHALDDDSLSVALKNGSLQHDDKELLRVMTVLSAMEALIDHAQGAYLYVTDGDWLVSAGGVELESSKRLGEQLHNKLRGELMEPSFWLDRTRAGEGDEYRVVDGLGYVRGIPASFQKPLGYYIVLLDEPFLYDMYGDVEFDNGGGLVAISPQGHLYAAREAEAFVQMHVKAEELETWLARKQPGLEGVSSSERVSGERLLVHAIQSVRTGWTYLSVVPLAELTAKVSAVSKKIRVITWLLVGAAAAAILLLSNNVYQRFRAMLEQLYTRNSALSKEVESFAPEREQYWLRRLLQEPLGEEDMEVVRSLSLQSDRGAGYAAICIQSGDRIIRSEQEQAEATGALLRRIRGMEDSAGGRFTQMGYDMIGGLFELERMHMPEGQHVIMEWAQRLLEMESGQGNLHIIGIGPLLTHREALHHSFEGARKAMQQRLTDDSRYLFLHRDEGQSSQAYMYPFEQEKAIMAQLKLGNGEQAKEALRIFCAAMRSSVQPDERQIYESIMILLASVMRVMFEGNTLTIGALFRYPLHERLQELRSLPEIEDWLANDVFLPIVSQVIKGRQEREGVADQLVRRAMGYVQLHYDQDISLHCLADMLSVPEAQLGQVFRQEIGLTFTEYVIATRIDRAKELLRSTEMRVSEIADRLRYNNSQNFIRMFKKETGITPGEYRKQH
ncbi:helix-turn-helix domain-containing protein [Paenibacillus sp. strain BS8-2]